MRRKGLDRAPMKKRRRSVVLIATVLSVLVALFAAVVLRLELERYERGVLDVCATQQDAYVQLVLDQINLKENRSDAQIITEILSSLDASTNKYWVFSRDQDMLFVKDELETNKYKGLTTASYYASDSAHEFLKGLSENCVIHGEIDIEGKEYIASGTAFTYNGDAYRICLLTNRRALLDNNRFLEAKVGLCILAAVVLITLCVVTMALTLQIQRLQKDNREQLQLIEGLNRSLASLNERYSQRDIYDARTNFWRKEAFSGFLQKLLEREKAYPLAILLLRCADSQERRSVQYLSRYIMDPNVLRFEWDSRTLVLLFVQSGVEAAEQELPAMLFPGQTRIASRLEITEDMNTSAEEIETKLTEVTAHECSLVPGI